MLRSLSGGGLYFVDEAVRHHWLRVSLVLSVHDPNRALFISHLSLCLCQHPWDPAAPHWCLNKNTSSQNKQDDFQTYRPTRLSESRHRKMQPAHTDAPSDLSASFCLPVFPQRRAEKMNFFYFFSSWAARLLHPHCQGEIWRTLLEKQDQ